MAEQTAQPVDRAPTSASPSPRWTRSARTAILARRVGCQVGGVPASFSLVEDGRNGAQVTSESNHQSVSRRTALARGLGEPGPLTGWSPAMTQSSSIELASGQLTP